MTARLAQLRAALDAASADIDAARAWIDSAKHCADVDMAVGAAVHGNVAESFMRQAGGKLLRAASATTGEVVPKAVPA